MSESIDHNRRHFFGAAAMTIAAAQLGMLGCAKGTVRSNGSIAIRGKSAFSQRCNGLVKFATIDALRLAWKCGPDQLLDVYLR